MRWSILRENATEPWPIPPYTYIYSTDGLRTEKLYIHDIATNKPGSLRFFPNGKLIADSETVVLIKQWLLMTGIYPQAIEFTGILDKHQLDPVALSTIYQSPSPVAESPSTGLEKFRQYMLGLNRSLLFCLSCFHLG